MKARMKVFSYPPVPFTKPRGSFSQLMFDGYREMPNFGK